jgi:hypothetical protein
VPDEEMEESSKIPKTTSPNIEKKNDEDIEEKNLFGVQ